MQPAVQATTRTPGPSTAEPVVKEWRNPMSPVASAVRTSASATSLPRSTRSSNGLFAASGVDPVAGAPSAMESPVDDVHLLLARQPYEVHRVAGDADGEVRVLLQVVHRVHERLAVQHVHVHVVAGDAEERVEDAGEVLDA